MKSKMKICGNVFLGMLLLGGLMISSCSKKSASKPKTPVGPTNPGGYDSSEQIATGSLVSYFAFNGNVSDSKTGLTGTNSGGTFVNGFLTGTQAWKGSTTSYSYISYPAEAALTNLQSFTISAWLNDSQPLNNPGAIPAAGLGEQSFFEIADDSAWQANLHLGLVPFTSNNGTITTPNTDTLQLKIILTNNFNPAMQYQQYYLTAYLDTAVSKWTQVVVTYNAASSMLEVYENGVAVPIGGPYTNYPGQTGLELYQKDPGSLTNTNNAAAWGSLKFANVTGEVVGAWAVNTTPPLSIAGIQPWAGNYAGALVHLRIYNSALDATDVNSLYILEKAGF